jgi:hypothetical protein
VFGFVYSTTPAGAGQLQARNAPDAEEEAVLTDRVLEEGSLSDDDEGISFDIRIPWYRSLPLSCVEGLDVTVDGAPIAATDVRIAFNGATYALDELPPLHDDWWQMTDPARVTVPRADGALPTESHDVDVTLALRIPYIVEEGRRLVMHERCVKTLAGAAS